MSKKIFLIVLPLLLLASTIVLAQNMRIISPESSVIIYAGETNEVNIPIKNDGTTVDSVYVSVWPTQWVTLEKYKFTIESGESELLSLFVSPPEDAEEGIHIFTITTQSLDTNKTTTNSLFLNVRRKTNVFISEVKLNKEIINPGEMLEIESVLTNLHKTQKHKVFLTTKIIDENERMIKKFEETINLDPKTVKIIKNFYEIDKSQKFGEYRVDIQLKDSLNKLLDDDKKIFEVQKNFEISEYKTDKYGVFYKLTSIEVINKGNVAGGYKIEESLPEITKYFFYPEVEPDKEEKKNNRMLYVWEINNLEPGQIRIIRYRLRFFNVLIVVSILSIMLMLVYEYITKPLIKKKYYGLLSGEEELKITLSIKNRRRKGLKNVIVRDIVPPIAKVVKKFDTKKPEIKMSPSGTELIWKIDKIKPKEELILTYKIRPLIDVIGKLTLPRSYFTYKNKFKRESRVVSKSVSITSKVK